MSKPTAFSYIRFSTPEQRKGHSLERQIQAAKDWCDKHEVALDNSRSWHDLGKSAFLGDHRKNPDRHALAAFLRLVEEDKIPRGSYLIIESLDRLTREHVRAGLMLCLNLIEKGIKIVQLSPSELVYDDRSDEMSLMLAIVELSRGHRESKRKSELIGPAWRKKKADARAGKILTRRLPAWVTVQGDRLVLIPDRAETVRLIFRLARSGYGIPSIIRKLHEDNVPAFGRKGKWTRAYLCIMLKDRRAMGEYQPRRGKDKDGEVIPDYYPQAVTEEEWLAARVGAQERETGIPRTAQGKARAAGLPPKAPLVKRKRLEPNGVNIFNGLLKNARQGDPYAMTQRLSKQNGKLLRRYPVLVNTNSESCDSRAYSFPYLVLEEAVLKCLREIDPAEILPGGSKVDEVTVIKGQLDGVEAELTEASAYMDAHGFSATIGKRVTALEDRKKELVALLAAARQKASSPLSEVWAETKNLAATLATAADPRDTRLRLRSALHRIAESITLLVVPWRHERFAAVQINFTDGGCRSYAILHKPASGRRKESWWCRSLSTVASPGNLDLRRREDAEALEKALAEVDLAGIEAGNQS
jgi:DNA invertase Pin-like site-specific DNA recombinase